MFGNIVDSLKVARRGRSSGMGMREGEVTLRMKGHGKLKKPVRVRQAELDRDKLEKIGRALATDKEAFDIEMKRRRQEEKAKQTIAASMGFKTVEQMKEEGMKVELRNSSEVLERVALQTLNKQFAKQMIAQRHTLKALKDQHGHLKLDYKLILRSTQDDDQRWASDALDVHIHKWERNVLHLRDMMAKAKHTLDTRKERIDKNRAIVTLRKKINQEARADITRQSKELEFMTTQVHADHSTIQNAEIQIKKISSELAVEVSLFKNGYKQKRGAFELMQRRQENRTFEDVLEDFSDDKITPAARRMMLKAAAENAKLKRGKEMLLHAKRRLKQLENTFMTMTEATGIDSIDALVAAIVKSEDRHNEMSKHHSDLETEISQLMKALTKSRRLFMEEVAAGSSAKILARQRQAKQVQAKVNRVERATSKYTVALETGRKSLQSISSNVMEILYLIKPASELRLKKFAKQHGVAGNEVVLTEALGEVDLWITTMKRIIADNNSVVPLSKEQRRRRASIMGPVKSSYKPGGMQRLDTALLKRMKQKFTRPEAPSVQSFASLTTAGDVKPETVKHMKDQVAHMVAEKVEKMENKIRRQSRMPPRRSSMGIMPSTRK
jgi:hypothetical protein